MPSRSVIIDSGATLTRRGGHVGGGATRPTTLPGLPRHSSTTALYDRRSGTIHLGDFANYANARGGESVGSIDSVHLENPRNSRADSLAALHPEQENGN